MAKIFAVQGGGQRGPALAELPWPTCRELLDIDDMCATEDRPRFGTSDKAGIFPTRIVIQVDEDEAQRFGLRARYFECPLAADEARARLNSSLQGPQTE